MVNYVTNGGQGKAAAIEAGYSEASAHVIASRLLRNPAIAQALVESVALRFATSGVKAAHRIDQLIDGAKSEYVRLEASKDVLDRLGATAPKRVAVTGAVSITIDLGE